MKDIIRLLVVALIGYGLYTVFMDREVDVQEELDESGTAGRCVQRLQQAGKDAEKAVRTFSTAPVDLESWQSTYSKLQRHLALSTAACNCDDDACIRGRQAIQQLRSLVSEMHDEHRAVSKPLTGAGERVEAYLRSVEEAKALNR